jgi:hypothetical protein
MGMIKFVIVPAVDVLRLGPEDQHRRHHSDYQLDLLGRHPCKITI